MKISTMKKAEDKAAPDLGSLAAKANAEPKGAEADPKGARQGRRCPVWVGYLLASPIRKLIQNPTRILRPFIQGGMTVLDFGSAMGFFSLPMAQLVGPKGKVLCVDVQEKMLTALRKRAGRAALLNRIETRLCGEGAFGLSDLQAKLDFALAFAVVHEVTGPERLFSEIQVSLKPGAKLLVAEPKGHVPEDDFARTVSLAQQAGLVLLERPRISGSHTALFARNG